MMSANIMKSIAKFGFMAKIDEIKEFIGYLKVVFGILVAIDISIIGWLFKNEESLSNIVFYCCHYNNYKHSYDK